MNEKEFALKIKTELEEAINYFKQEKDFIDLENSYTTKYLTQELNLNINKIINECNKLNIKTKLNTKDNAERLFFTF